jgi:hypothetical protein
VLSCLVVLVSALLLMSVTGCGCKLPALPTGPAASADEPFELRSGYAYLADLATTHPLYPELRRLDETLEAMRRSSAPEEISFPSPRGGEAFLSAPAAPAFPRALWGLRLATWRESAPPLVPPDASFLSDDLQVLLNWQGREEGEKLATEMRLLEESEGRELAKLRIAAVRRRHEELANLGLRNPEQEDVAALTAAGEAARKIWQQIDAEVAVAKAQSDRRLETVREQKRRTALATLAEYERSLQQEMAKRTKVSVSAGREERAEAEKALEAMKPETTRVQSAERLASSTGASTLRAAAAAQAVRSTYLKVRDRQIHDIAVQKADLTRQILDATDAAARAAAFEQGVELRLLPGDEPAGSNVTETVRGALKQRWSQSP